MAQHAHARGSVITVVAAIALSIVGTEAQLNPYTRNVDWAQLMPECTYADDLADRVTQLESRVEELAMVQDLLLRVLSTTRPLAGVLEHFGATETQEHAFYLLLDDVATRARGPERDQPSFAHFRLKLAEIVPALREDRQFIQLIIDTLKVERPAYRELHAYVMAHGWPSWE